MTDGVDTARHAAFVASRPWTSRPFRTPAPAALRSRESLLWVVCPRASFTWHHPHVKGRLTCDAMSRHLRAIQHHGEGPVEAPVFDDFKLGVLKVMLSSTFPPSWRACAHRPHDLISGLIAGFGG